MHAKLKRKLLIGFGAVCAIIFLFSLWEAYVPISQGQGQAVIYTLQKGMGYSDVAADLKNKGIIKSSLFFKLYAIISGKYSRLQAGMYDLSESMSIALIVRKFTMGDVIKNKITIVEGWDAKDIGKYLESKKFMTQKDFLDSVKNDLSQDFDILKDKPKHLSLEGYIFPDTYEISGQEPKELLKNTLSNFDKKLTPELRHKISLQHKSVFEIITMASMIEKEVKTSDDKKIVSGILWKRIENGIPLQVDATINYITDKNDARVAIKDTKIHSPYNTYKYYGLPLGPISNPGMDSILAAIYPKDSPYWYYLSVDGDGKTIFSKTLQEHNAAVVKYLQ